MLGFIDKIRQAIFKGSIVDEFIRDTSVDLLRQMSVSRMRDSILSSREAGITDEKYASCDLIVSLTSYGKRIHDVSLTIESLMRQTLKPNKIILWLSEEEFNLNNLPRILCRQMERGLTIEFCRDLRSYTKLVHSILRFPDDIIITVDDDVLYQQDLIENLLNGYRQQPKMIHFCRGHRMKLDKANMPQPYMKWEFGINDEQVSNRNFFLGIGGVLYPPHSLHTDVTDANLFMNLAPFADDVWFNAMAMLKGTLSRKVFTHNYYGRGKDFIDMDFETQQTTALFNINAEKNDKQIKDVFERYNLYSLIRS
ncbi:MAG: hypothetical protein LBL74_08190 [Bacteroidales bacterium]|jgi:hypothetical protein|nr:hypothetical protein [Bacteroidales bacterium]